MSPRRPLYDPHQTTTKPRRLPPAASQPSVVAEPAPPEYHITTGWIDAADRTRTWLLKNPHGTQMAEICTKRDANKLATLLNRIMDDEHGPAR